MIFDDEQVAIQLSEAWEHDTGKDELNVVLQARTALLEGNGSWVAWMLRLPR